MNMATHFEHFLEGYLDTQLFVQKWTPTTPAGTLIITHGQGEHSGSYERLLEALAPLELEIYAWDLRGHGRSEGLRGYAESFDDYCRDFEIIAQFVQGDRKAKSKPLFLLGHSMGGTIQLKTLIDYPRLQFSAQVLCSPLLGLALLVPKIKDAGASLLNFLTPQLTLWNEIQDQQLTRDSTVIAEYQKDSLRHQRISPGVYLGFLHAFEYIKQRTDKIPGPSLWQIPEDDQVVSTPATRHIHENLDKDRHRLIIYKDRKHELYNDLDREEVFTDLRAYLKNFIG